MNDIINNLVDGFTLQWAIVLLIVIVTLCILFGRRLRDYCLYKGQKIQLIWLTLVIISFLVFFWGVLHLFHISSNHGYRDTLLNFIIFDSGILNPVVGDSESALKPGGTVTEDEFQYWFRVIITVIIAVSGMVLLGGMLVSTFLNIFERRLAEIESGKVIYKYKEHTIFIGYNSMIPGLIRQIETVNKYSNSGIRGFINRWKGRNIYVILTSEDLADVRRQLTSQLSMDMVERVLFIHGSRDSEEILKSMRPLLARRVFILAEQTDSNDVDSVNLSCMRMISHLAQVSPCQVGKRKLDCHVQFRYQATFTLFQRTISEKLFMSSDEGTMGVPGGPVLSDRVEFISFNYCQMWAQKLWVDGTYEYNGISSTCLKNLPSNKSVNVIKYPPLDYEPLPADSNKQVHLVIVGMTSMGIALGIEAALTGHYANYKKRKTRITFIDCDADVQENIFASLYPVFYNGVDVWHENDESPRIGTCSDFTFLELEFINRRVESPEVRGMLVKWAQDPDQVLTIAICFSDSAQSMAVGLYLPQELYRPVIVGSTDQTRTVPILICQQIPGNILAPMFCNPNLDDGNQVVSKCKLYPFGMLDGSYDIKLRHMTMAKLLNYIYDREGNVGSEESTELVKIIEEGWSKKKLIDKWSSRYFIDHLPVMLRMLDYSYSRNEDPPQIPKDKVKCLAPIEHNRWVVEKLLNGYNPPLSTEYDLIKMMRALTNGIPALIKKMENSDGTSDDLCAKLAYLESAKKVLELAEDEEKKLKESIRSQGRHECLVPHKFIPHSRVDNDFVLCKNIPWLLRKNDELSCLDSGNKGMVE